MRSTVGEAVELPEGVRDARVDPGPSALRGVLVGVVAALVLLGAWVWWSGREADRQTVEAPPRAAAGSVAGSVAASSDGEVPSGEAAPGALGVGGAPVPSAVPTGSTVPPGASGGGSPGERPSSAAAAGPVVVHVAGRVREPGVVELPTGGRVADAIEAAGGVTGKADLRALNLARPLVDGEQVVVLAPGEEPPPPALRGVPANGPGGVRSPVTSMGEDAGGGAVVDLNNADQAALEELPGVGPVTAGHILEWRTQNGGFTSVDELMEVSGIGEKTLETLRPHVTVG